MPSDPFSRHIYPLTVKAIREQTDMSNPGKAHHHGRLHQGRRPVHLLFQDAAERRSAWVMMFAVYGCFRDGAAGVSWELTARWQGIATPRQGKPRPGSATKTGHLLTAARSPVMSIIAWIVPGLGAGLRAGTSAASTRGRLPL